MCTIFEALVPICGVNDAMTQKTNVRRQEVPFHMEMLSKNFAMMIASLPGIPINASCKYFCYVMFV